MILKKWKASCIYFQLVNRCRFGLSSYQSLYICLHPFQLPNLVMSLSFTQEKAIHESGELVQGLTGAEHASLGIWAC